MIQGDTKGNLWLNYVRNFLTNPTDDQIYCQYPKSVLLNLGANSGNNSSICKVDPLNTTYCAAWTEVVIPFQLFKIGNVVLPGIPSEWTTMLGRRLRKVLQSVFNDEQLIIPISGLSNVYIDYITTFEE